MKPSEAARVLPWPKGSLSDALGLGETRPFHEADFLPAALEIIERPASPAARGVALSIAAFSTIAVAWACFGTVDIIATAPGSILPVGNSKLIQPVETGVVRSIQVTDGQHVRAGQVLVELDAVAAQSDRDKAAGDLVKTDLEIARLEALRRVISGESPDLLNPPAGASHEEIDAARASAIAQAAEYQAKLANLDKQMVEKNAEAAEDAETVERLKATLPVAEEQEVMRRKLVEQGFGRGLDWMNAKEHLIEQQHGLPAAVQHRAQALAQGEALRHQAEQARAEFAKTVLGDLAAARQKQGELQAETRKDAEHVTFMTLKAPIDGTVQQLAVHTIGGVVTPAQQLMVLAPDAGGLVVEAHIDNKDIGFVRAGQDVEIKVEAFTFTRYGLIPGKVLDLSRDSVSSAPSLGGERTAADGKEPPKPTPSTDTGGYVAHVALLRNQMMTENGPLPLGPGMKVTAEVKTGKRTIISFLLSPVVRYRQESLRER